MTQTELSAPAAGATVFMRFLQNCLTEGVPGQPARVVSRQHTTHSHVKTFAFLTIILPNKGEDLPLDRRNSLATFRLYMYTTLPTAAPDSCLSFLKPPARRPALTGVPLSQRLQQVCLPPQIPAEPSAICAVAVIFLHIRLSNSTRPASTAICRKRDIHQTAILWNHHRAAELPVDFQLVLGACC